MPDGLVQVPLAEKDWKLEAAPPRAGASVPEEMLLAFVASVEHDAAALLRSPHAGCVELWTPAVLTWLIH